MLLFFACLLFLLSGLIAGFVLATFGYDEEVS